MATKLQIRRDYDYKWLTVNPILAEGEIGFVINSNKIKIGDGKHHWQDLPYLADDSEEVKNLVKEFGELSSIVAGKADSDKVYDKDSAEERFIDDKELETAINNSTQYIIKTVGENYYTKSESDAIFAHSCELGNVKKTLEEKIDALDSVYAKKVNVYTKSESDEALSKKQDRLSSVNAGTGLYITEDDKHNMVINAVLGENQFEDSDTIAFETNTETKKIRANLKVQVYTKKEVDDKITETNDKINEVKGITISNQAEIEKIKENISGVDFSKRFVQIADDIVLTDKNMLVYNGLTGKWETISSLGLIKTWNE